MPPSISAADRVRFLKEGDFEGLKNVLLEIISEFDEKIENINEKINDLSFKISD